MLDNGNLSRSGDWAVKSWGAFESRANYCGGVGQVGWFDA